MNMKIAILLISKLPLKELNKNLKTIISNAKREEDIKNKLLGYRPIEFNIN